MSICMFSLGNKVRALRIENNLTQFQLACDIDTDKSLISHLECGVAKNVTLKTLFKLAKIFGIDVVDLLKT